MAAPKTVSRIAPDVAWLPISFVNVYFVGRPGEPWVLIDSGLPGRAKEIYEAAEARFGGGARPTAILLTHGHFDHAGSARELAEHWDAPIYAHPLELPYLTGRSAYPPPDPTVTGAIAFLARFMPARSRDLRPHVHPLIGNDLPGMKDWRWVHTPGHSPGHISLFREADRVLLAGDALATTDMDSWIGLLTGKPVLARGGTPFNMDWEATRASVQAIAALNPRVIAAGHGIPIGDDDVVLQLQHFARDFRPPRRGRYVRRAAVTDDTGVVELPPAPFDPVPFATAAGLIAAGAALASGAFDDVIARKR